MMESFVISLSRGFRVGAVGVVVMLPLVLGGCSKPLQLSLAGRSDLNSVDGGAGNAAQVRVYQLSNTTNFEQASVESFWADEEGVLGSELVGDPIRVVLYPNQSESFEFKVEKEAAYIGVAANFRQPDADHWREVFPVDQLNRRNKRLRVTIGSNRVVIE